MSADTSPMALFSKTLSFTMRKRERNRPASKLRVRSIDNIDYIEDMQFVEVENLGFHRINHPTDSGGTNNSSSRSISHLNSENDIELDINDHNRNNNISISSNSNNSSNREKNYEENIVLSKTEKTEREREIFLRAALQLLEQGNYCRMDQSPESIYHHNGSHTQQQQQQQHQQQQQYHHSHHISNRSTDYHTSNNHLGSLSSSSSTSVTNHTVPSKLYRPLLKSQSGSHRHNVEISSDVIRYGILRKAGRNGSAFSSLKPQWKSKYVELRYGKFTYEDESSNHLNSHLNWGNESTNHHRKEISLAVDTSQCRPFRIRSPHGSCVFELTHYGGPRRLWMAGSEKERDLWISAILNAMVGSLDDQLGLSHELRLKVFSKQMEALNQTSTIPNTNNSNDETASISSKISDSHISDVTEKGPMMSYDGPAAAFANDIAKFVTVQTAVKLASDSLSYHSVISRLLNKHVNITIPVYYVKTHASDSNFALCAQDILNQQTLLAVETSQIWKDLQRDAISINNELIRGESGTEAMVGALMRHIMDKVEIIRLTNDDFTTQNSNSNNSNNNQNTDSNNNNNNNNSSNSSVKDHNSSMRQKDMSRFDITEAQTLACARDILMLCNRTQSGGDTYFCVDALLCDKTKDLCIITPLAAEADPIIINVDIVKGVDPNANHDSHKNNPLSLSSNITIGKSKSGKGIETNPQNSLSAFNRGRSRSVAAIEGLDNEAPSSRPISLNLSKNKDKDGDHILPILEAYEGFDNLSINSSIKTHHRSSDNLNKLITNDSNAVSSPIRKQSSISASGTPLKLTQNRYRRNSETTERIAGNPNDVNENSIESYTRRNSNSNSNNNNDSMISSRPTSMNSNDPNSSLLFPNHNKALVNDFTLTLDLDSNDDISPPNDLSPTGISPIDSFSKQDLLAKDIIHTSRSNPTYSSNHQNSRDITTSISGKGKQGQQNQNQNQQVTESGESSGISANDIPLYDENMNDQVNDQMNSSHTYENLDDIDGVSSVAWENASIISDITFETLSRTRSQQPDPTDNTNCKNTGSILGMEPIEETDVDYRDRHSTSNHDIVIDNLEVDEIENPIDTNDQIDSNDPNDTDMMDGQDLNTLGVVLSDEVKNSPKRNGRFKLTSGTSFFKSFSKGMNQTFTPMTNRTKERDRHDSNPDPYLNLSNSSVMENNTGSSISMPNSVSKSNHMGMPAHPSPFTFFRGRTINSTTDPSNTNNNSSNNISNGSYISHPTSELLRQLPMAESYLFSPMRKVALASNTYTTNNHHHHDNSSSSHANPNVINPKDGKSSQNSPNLLMGSKYCIRIEVKVNSRYRVCDSNPMDDINSTWGEVLGQFKQIFFIKSGCKGRPVVSDRIVSVLVDKVNPTSHQLA